MASVRQAHLPGNYELYNEASNELGEVLCKLCWEDGGIENVDLLDTVWVSSDGWVMVWWLCRSHADELKTGGRKEIRLLKILHGVVRAPGLEVEN